MSLDGKLLRRAKIKLDKRRADREEEFRLRRERAYAKNPRLRELDRRLRGTVADAVAAALRSGENPQEALNAIRDENLSLQEERALLLLKAGFPADYLTWDYQCPICRDTGYDGTKICRCLMELYREEQRTELSSLLKLGEETFDSFDLSWYSPRPDPATGASPREVMGEVYEACREYARKFSESSLNLFLSGGTGLGKTFLSACIAREVSERGFSVVYDTAASVFEKYRDVTFQRGGQEEARDEVRRLESCDLLILDDLGTELPSAFVTSALYTLLNARLTGKRKTVVSSNLTVRELAARYSPAVMSRLQGEYEVLRFVGEDIRMLKKQRGSSMQKNE